MAKPKKTKPIVESKSKPQINQFRFRDSIVRILAQFNFSWKYANIFTIKVFAKALGQLITRLDKLLDSVK